MVLARMKDGRVIVHNAIALNDAGYEIDRLIRDAGFQPRRRRQDYSVIEESQAA